ncbi:MAG: VWA domain-containing protein [Thaumarchaeota archaeon]|nr:VWA domain-containing protein [Nitrososphaerota archaeon]
MKPISPAAGAASLDQRIVAFCRILREASLPVTPAETIDAVSAVQAAGILDERTFHHALRTCLSKRPGDMEAFEREYARFWKEEDPALSAGEERREEELPQETRSKAAGARTPAQVPSGIQRRSAGGEFFAIFSSVERTQRKDFALDMSEVQMIGRSWRRLRRRLATVKGGRYARSSRGTPELGRTLRQAIGGRELVKLELEDRSISRVRLVVLCDISGSMERHSPRLLKMLHQAANKVPHSRVFAFSTRLLDLSDVLSGTSLLQATRAVSDKVEVWGSGTRIGEALHELLTEHHRYLGPRTVLVIVSDGWELGDLEVLRSSMMRLRSRVSRVVWFNPLADDPEFEPSAAGMRTVVPYLDFLGGLETFSSPREFEKVFGKSIGPVGPAGRSRRSSRAA